MKFSAAAVGFVLFFGLLITSAQANGEKMTIQKGRQVSLDYTLKVDGEVVDSSDGKQPLKYTQGQGQIIPGLEKELAGLKVGDAKKVTVAPQDGYGEVNPNAITKIPRSSLPPGQEPQVGMMLQMQTKDGRVLPAVIKQVDKDSVTLDLNHPLAGKTLNFDVKVVDIK